MRCILHIGTEKTGTTSFQRHFSVNRDSLFAQKVWYPRALGGEGHRLLSMYAMSLDHSDDAFRNWPIETQEQLDKFRENLRFRFAQEALNHPDAKVCVVSSEHLQSRLRTVEQIAQVRAFLDPYFAHIQVYAHLRPQVEVQVSLASTRSRHGGAVRRAFFDRIQPSDPYYNYKHLIDAWTEVFGDENVTCIPFKKIPDITSYIIGELAVDTTRLTTFRRVNEALDVRAMAIVNALADSKTQQKIHHTILDLLPVEQTLQLDQAHAREIQGRFVHSNAALVASRSDLVPGDLVPKWDKFPKVGNLDILEHRSPFAETLGQLVGHFNRNADNNQ